jgi:hypothetical protein
MGVEKIYTQGKDIVSDGASRLKDAVKTGIDAYTEERKSRHQ